MNTINNGFVEEPRRIDFIGFDKNHIDWLLHPSFRNDLLQHVRLATTSRARYIQGGWNDAARTQLQDILDAILAFRPSHAESDL